MYRKPGDLKWRGRKPKHHRHHGRGFGYYRYGHGDYWRWIKRHAWRSDRQMVRQELAHGREPWTPRTGRNSAMWDWM